ncbi:MAG: response regulator [Candidatus Glassbacteria bacterium]
MKYKILVVEDDDDNRVLLAKLLEAQGYDVYEASNGEEAIEITVTTTPDLVLMDMGLPRISGYDATRKIKDKPGLGKIPIVALTAFAMEQDKQKVLDAGCDGYITKPYDIFDLLERIKEYLGNGGNGGKNNP